ncbi:hypothetical protein AWZ03_011003 [Drosophila navojoa]|uniref:Gustatory receptor n=1 Tax=Drosophila navojoa TaxID=7232 RepID=A0A484B1I8_DRONA|nr:hypothetical protein AWZ03_011003 [Drosophila navojoa]
MCSVPLEQHSPALRFMRLLMCLALIVPPRPHRLRLRLLYTGAMVVYLCLISRWRIAFNYHVEYDRLNDTFSYVLDLLNFVALTVSHFVISFQLIWQSRSSRIEAQFLHIQNVLYEKIGHKVNAGRSRLITNGVFCLLLLRILILLGSTVYNNTNSNESLLLIANFYSQVVLILRCSEFTLHSALVLTIYQEMEEAASTVISGPESLRWDTWALHRLPLRHIACLQQLHLLLWNLQRDIEKYFERALIVLMLKFFIDTSVLPYWAYVNKIRTDNVPMQIWCATEELGILLEMSVPCWFWTRCDQLQRKFRAVFHGVSVDRRNEQLNTALQRISAQLGQESFMWHVPGELHAASLRCINRLKRWLLLLPPHPLLQLRLLYTVSLLSYLAFVLHWRFSFNYGVVYNRNDNFSRAVDLLNFVTLTAAHLVVAMELIWQDRSEQIEQQLERVRYVLRVQFGQKVNMLRVHRYCRIINSILLTCCLALLLMTIYNNLATNMSRLLVYAFYSEVILLLRLSEFSVFAVLILVFYMELTEVSCRLILELDKTRFEVWSLRRLSLELLYVLQHLHGLLWNTVRLIERNFAVSLIVVLLKYFVDISVLPYWMFVNNYNHVDISTTYYCATEESCKLLLTFLPSYICTRCEVLNTALYRLSAQLGQESFRFSAGGLMVINNESLGKFIFGMISYIIICIQFRLALIDNSPEEVAQSFVTVARRR